MLILSSFFYFKKRHPHPLDFCSETYELNFDTCVLQARPFYPLSLSRLKSWDSFSQLLFSSPFFNNNTSSILSLPLILFSFYSLLLLFFHLWSSSIPISLCWSSSILPSSKCYKIKIRDFYKKLVAWLGLFHQLWVNLHC